MTSGIVYFEEVAENVKNQTGIENVQAIYPRIATGILNAENDIGFSAFIVRKIKSFALGDANYDGQYILLPDDFMGEYRHEEETSYAFQQNRIELTEQPGPDQVDLIYMGLLTDNKGYPVTSRNHLEAVVMRIVKDLYAKRHFLGKGSLNGLNWYNDEYNRLVMASRGNDVFPTDAEWDEIAILMNVGPYIADDSCTLTTEDPMGVTQGSTSDCGDLTIDMVAIYEAAKID